MPNNRNNGSGTAPSQTLTCTDVDREGSTVTYTGTLQPTQMTREELRGVYPPIAARQGLTSGVAIQAMQELEQHRTIAEYQNHLRHRESHVRHRESHDGLRTSIEPDPRYGYSVMGDLTAVNPTLASIESVDIKFNLLQEQITKLISTITELKEDNAYLKAVLDEEFSIKTKVKV